MNRLDKVFFFLLTVLLASMVRFNGDDTVAIAIGILILTIAVNIFWSKEK